MPDLLEPKSEQPVNTGLLDADFADVQPAPQSQPRQAQQPEVDQIALGVRQGLESMGINPETITEETLLEFSDVVRQQHLAMRQAVAARQFVLNHPDFELCDRNEREMSAYMESAGLDATDEKHFTLAYEQLKRQGRLVSSESRPTSYSSGLSESSQVRRPAPAPQDDESFRRELDALPLDQARELMLRRMREQR